MITCTRLLGFDAGHRVYGHESKCSHAHGHRYTVEIEARAPQTEHGTDKLGRVIDFSVLKQRVGGWIDEMWDHGFIVKDGDPLVAMLALLPGCAGGACQKYYVMAVNPTAENLAAHLGAAIIPGLLDDTEVEVIRVRVWETPNCFAEWKAPWA